MCQRKSTALKISSNIFENEFLCFNNFIQMIFETYDDWLSNYGFDNTNFVLKCYF